MKPIAEMSEQELQNLISFTSKGTTIYYSKLTSINSNTGVLTYDNAKTYSADGETLVAITKGKARYEAYRLSMTESDAKSLLLETADKILTNKFAEQIQPTIDKFNETFTNLHDTFSKAADNLDVSTAIATRISNLSDELEESVKKFDSKKLQTKLNEKIDELKPISKDVQEVVAKLRAMFP